MSIKVENEIHVVTHTYTQKYATINAMKFIGCTPGLNLTLQSDLVFSCLIECRSESYAFISSLPSAEIFEVDT